MPEIAEVKIMSAFINTLTTKVQWDEMRKSPETKIKTENIELNKSRIASRSRGKELMVFIADNEKGYHNLSFTMGMSGNWIISDANNIPKHSHLVFIGTPDPVCKMPYEKIALCMNDVRRFAKWKWVNDWDAKRGPDAIDDYGNFIANITANGTCKAFQKPIYEVMMNQQYFNGFGNYLRAEVLYRLNINPFQSLHNFIYTGGKEKVFEFYQLLRDVPIEAFYLGGGQLKNFENPFGVERQGFDTWMKCYGRQGMATIEDSNKRKFWYNPIFNK